MQVPFDEKTVKADFEKINQNHDPYKYYEVQENINSSSIYKNLLTREIRNFHKEKGITALIDVFVDSKLNNIKSTNDNFSIAQKEDFKKEYKKNFPNGLTFDVTDEKFYDYDSFKKAVDIFLKKEEINKNIVIDNTKFMLSYLDKNPQDFHKFSENYAEKDLKQNNLPPEKRQSFVKNLPKAVVKKTTELIAIHNLRKDSELAKSLTQFYKKQFKEAHEEVKKSNAEKQEVKQLKQLSQNMKVKF